MFASRYSVKSFLLAFALMVVASELYAVESIVVFALFNNKAVLEIDGKRRVLAAGKTSPEGVKLISSNSREAVLEIDGKQSTHELGSQISTRFTRSSEQPTIQIWSGKRGMYRTVGSINGLTVNFLVDTGASSVAMNANEAKRLGINYLLDGKPMFVSTASGVARAYSVKLDRVKVGEIELRNVGAAIVEGNSPTEVLLGMTYLGNFELSNDGKLMTLKKKY